MLVIFEGHLSYEAPLVDVLRQVLNAHLAGPAVLQLADPMTGARGDILIENCQTLVGAQMYEPKAMGYPALRKLCEFALADYRLVQPDPAKANRGDHSLNLEIERIIPLIPDLPEDPASIAADPLERIFSNNGVEEQSVPVQPNMSRLDPHHASGLFEAVSVEMVQSARTENWRPLQGGEDGGRPVRKARSEFQSLSDRIIEELAESHGGGAPSHGDEEEDAGQRAKIKYKQSNPFKDPKTFVLTIFSLFKLALPRVILPGLALLFLYQGGTYLYKKYKPEIAAMQQPHHAAAVTAPSRPTAVPKPRPHVSAPATTAAAAPYVPPEPTVHHSEPARPAVRPNTASRPPVAPRHEARHADKPAHASAAAAHAKPDAAPKPPSSNEPIPEYKGPSSATGEAPKHRHAYQTMPTE